MNVADRTAANRLRLAGFFDTLTPAELNEPSLCRGWSVRDVLGHLVAPLMAGLPSLIAAVVRNGGSPDRANTALARAAARKPVSELTTLLRHHATTRVRAPGVGPMGQMADGCIHLRDCARPLGRSDDVSIEDWEMVLSWMVGGVPGLVSRKQLGGLLLETTDSSWRWGQGLRVAGPSEALAMAVAGRVSVLGELEGPGVVRLRVAAS